jgi:hypothetical protein
MRKLTTEEFIEKAKIKHGDKYDYSLVEYQGAKNNVKINCKTHGLFHQSPTNHTQGKGCPRCSGVGRVTNEIFINRCSEIHGGKYDYSMVNCSSGRSKVKIKCAHHGYFYQIAESHMSGKGCRKCGGKERLTLELFIERATSVHANKYDYSRVVYRSAKEKVEIICKTHGSFMQCPDKHINAKQGCNDCGNISVGKALAFTLDDFIEQAKAAHGDKYDYSEVDYKLAHDKVVISCPIHGRFKQTPALHVRSCGCTKCGDEMIGKALIKSADEFISNSKSVHGEKYDYSLVRYRGAHKKVKILCRDHGVFEQTPDSHINTGCGCPKCSVHGFKDNELASLYVLRSLCGSYLKIGISNEISVRVKKLHRTTPFEFDVIEKFYAIGLVVRNMESKFHKVFDNAGFKGFDGATEWFHYDSEKLQQLKNYGELINEN